MMTLSTPEYDGFRMNVSIDSVRRKTTPYAGGIEVKIRTLRSVPYLKIRTWLYCPHSSVPQIRTSDPYLVKLSPHICTYL